MITAANSDPVQLPPFTVTATRIRLNQWIAVGAVVLALLWVFKNPPPTRRA